MRLDFAQMQPIGVYLTDATDIYNSTTQRAFVEDKYKGYLPIVDCFNIRGNAEVIFSDTRDKSREVTTFDRSLSTKNLDQETIRSKKIETTHNDLFMGPHHILLNFTNHTLTANMPNEYRKSFPRINQDKFEDYLGKIMIFSIYTLNTPALIQATTGNGNYLEAMVNKLKTRQTPEMEEMRRVYEYANSKWPLFKQMPNGCIANSIKVICLQVIEEKELLTQRDHSLYLRNKDVLLSFENILEIPENPSTQLKGIGGDQLLSIIKDHSFVCYIVDNNDSISERYINVAGNIRKVNKIKDPKMINGLYVIQTGENNSPDIETICPLEDIDKNDFIYRSAEEAIQGASSRQRYKDEVDMAKMELENVRVASSMESLKLKQEYDIQLLQMKADYEARKLELEEKVQAIKAEVEKSKVQTADKKNTHEDKKYDLDYRRELLKLEAESERYRMDRISSRNKHYYEERRYERDSTIETLKTVGAIVGLMATGYVLYKKFSDA